LAGINISHNLDEDEEDEDENSFVKYYCNAFKFYHRIFSMVCSSNANSSRALKALNTFTQFTIAICITSAIFAYKGMKGKEVAILLSFMWMRLIQPAFNLLETASANSGKTF